MSGEQLTIEIFKETRSALIEQAFIDPKNLATELTDLCDNLLKALYPKTADTALIALGSYADYELTPNSDLDLVLLHKPKVDVEALAQSLWYPIWDSGLKIDNSVRTPKEAVKLALQDPRVLNGLCRPRLIAGDLLLVQELEQLLAKAWHRHRKTVLPSVIEYARTRHEEAGELAYLLEPDLKEAKGGLRDFTVLKSLEYLEGTDLLGTGLLSIYDAQKILQDTRMMLHHKNPRSGNRLGLEDQDMLAEALGFRDADRLMEHVAQAGKTISFAFDTVAHNLLGSLSRKSNKKLEIPEPFFSNGYEIDIQLEDGMRPSFSMLLKLAVLAGTHNLRISEQALEKFAGSNLQTPKRYSDQEYLNLISFLSLGKPMIRIAEALDHFRLFELILPEWTYVRSKPQRNAYHTYTVDRHLLETVANASQMRRRVKRPDLLLIGALLHDIGKGLSGDHTEEGAKIVPAICSRFGMDQPDTDIVTSLVTNHLTLADTATRRDLNDPSTITQAAQILKDPQVVEILEVLTEADSLATGPSAWSNWKAKLISELASKTILTLEGTQPQEDDFPGNRFDYLIDQANNGWAIEADAESLKIVAPDKPGLFSLVTGTLALMGVEILSARIGSKNSSAIEIFQLRPNPIRPPDWIRFKKELQKSFDEPTSLPERLQNKAKNYARAKRRSGVKMVPSRVVVAPKASSRATVVEVWATDRIGLLHDISSVMAKMSLSIAHAKLTTLGDDVIDSFYLTDGSGSPITDMQVLSDLSAAILDVLEPDGLS